MPKALDVEFLSTLEMNLAAPQGCFSPDGMMLAFTVQRPASSRQKQREEFHKNIDHSDIYVVDTHTKSASPKLICQTGSKGGTWEPRWSPSGNFLSFYHKVDNDVQLTIWSRKEDQIIGHWPVVKPLHPYHQTYEWLATDSIATRHGQVNPQLAPDSPRNKITSTATVFETHPSQDVEDFSHSTYLSVFQLDPSASPVTECRQQLPLFSAIIDHDTRHFSVSTDKSTLFIVQSRPLQKYNQSLSSNSKIEFFADDESRSIKSFIWSVKVTSALAEVFSSQFTDYSIDPLSLTPLGSGRLTCFVSCRSDNTNARLALIDHVEQSIHVYSQFAFEIKEASTIGKWTVSINDTLLFKAKRKLDTVDSNLKSADHWWQFRPEEENKDRQIVCISDRIEKSPSRLFQVQKDVFVGLSNGELLVYRVDDGEMNSQILPPDIHVSKIILPVSYRNLDAVVELSYGHLLANLVLEITNNGTNKFLVYQDIKSPPNYIEQTGSIVGIATNGIKASELTESSFAYAVYGSEDSSIRLSSIDTSKSIYTTNTTLKDYLIPDTHYFSTQGPNGLVHNSRIIVPAGVKDTSCAPMIVTVYPLTEHKPMTSISAEEIFRCDFWNPYLLASSGFIVLEAGLPSKNDDAIALLDEVRLGLELVVKDALSRGYGNTNRLFLLGHSWGAEAVPHIIAKTEMFVAAAAAAGTYNFESVYGTFFGGAEFPRGRISKAHFSQIYLAADWRGLISEPPWENPDEYAHLSSIRKVRDINTPLLLLHGENDYIPIQQSEELFTALWKANKTAEFIRYANEGHIITSTENIKHFITSVCNWFCRFDDGV